MSFNFPSNRRLHDKNTKAVPHAISKLKTVAPIAQERFENALKVNGFPCILYNKLNSGIKCSCSEHNSESPIQTLLDEQGNASQDHLQTLLNDADFGIEDYGTTLNKGIETKTRPSSIKVDSEMLTRKKYQPSHDLDDPLATDIESDINTAFDSLENSFKSTKRCGVCFGTGFVGGYSPFNSNRII